MNQIQVVGLNHRKAPVELRERVAVPADQALRFLADLRTRPAVEEALLISTCNRVEAWMTGDPEQASQLAISLIAGRGGLAPDALRPYLYDLRGEQAVAHLFRVASSLDSMVVGETQILAQVKEAYRFAKEAGSTGRTFNILFQKAFNVAKRVHTETRISEGKLSVSSVAVDLAEKVFRVLKEKRVLVIGAGETGELTARCFRDRGVVKMLIANRSADRGQEVAARLEATPVTLDHLDEVIATSDIVVSCALVDQPLVTAPMLERAMVARGRQPMFVIDLGVPRNVDPAADKIADLYCYNIDDLQGVVARNMAARKAKMEQGTLLVEEEARACLPVLQGPQ